MIVLIATGRNDGDHPGLASSGFCAIACTHPRHLGNPTATQAAVGTPPAQGLPPAPICYARLQLAAKAGRMNEAREWFAKFEEKDSQPRLLLITAAGVAGDSQAAERWFAAMQESDRTTTPAMADALVAAHAQAGDVELAGTRLLELLDGGIRTTALGLRSVLEGYAEQGDWRGAEELLGRLAGRGSPEVQPDQYLLRCYANASPCPEERVVQTLSHMKAGRQPLDEETRLRLNAALGRARASELVGATSE